MNRRFLWLSVWQNKIIFWTAIEVHVFVCRMMYFLQYYCVVIDCNAIQIWAILTTGTINLRSSDPPTRIITTLVVSKIGRGSNRCCALLVIADQPTQINLKLHAKLTTRTITVYDRSTLQYKLIFRGGPYIHPYLTGWSELLVDCCLGNWIVGVAYILLLLHVNSRPEVVFAIGSIALLIVCIAKEEIHHTVEANY